MRVQLIISVQSVGNWLFWLIWLHIPVGVIYAFDLGMGQVGAVWSRCQRDNIWGFVVGALGMSIQISVGLLIKWMHETYPFRASIVMMLNNQGVCVQAGSLLRQKKSRPWVDVRGSELLLDHGDGMWDKFVGDQPAIKGKICSDNRDVMDCPLEQEDDLKIRIWASQCP